MKNFKDKIIFCFLFLPLLTNCTNKEEILIPTIEFSEIFNIPNDNYYIYIAKQYCPYCEAMEEYLNEYKKNSHETQMYYCDITNNSSVSFYDNEEQALCNTVGTNNLQNLKLLWAPSIYEIKNSIIVSFIYQMNDIQSFLEEK